MLSLALGIGIIGSRFTDKTRTCDFVEIGASRLNRA